MYDSLYIHVRNTISGSQHGFVRCRSTVSNLACYLNSISKFIDNKKQVDSVYLDFSKAFDSVCHALLIHKLNMGILGNAYNGRSPTFSTENNVWYSKYHKVHKLAHFCLSCISTIIIIIIRALLERHGSR